MLGTRVTFASSTVVMLLLAGCSGKEPAAAADADQDNALPEDPLLDPGYVSKTGGYVTGADAAYYCDVFANSTITVDPNQTLTGSKHSHDMWQGEDTKVIFDGALAPLGSGSYFFMPGAVVFPGASRADFTLNWDQAVAGVDGIKVTLNLPKIKLNLSGDVAFDYALKYDKPGQTQSVNYTYEQNDPAHAERTTWIFKLNLNNPLKEALGDSADVSEGSERSLLDKLRVRVIWTIHRGYDCLPVDAPHYDGWVNRTSFTFLDMTTTHDTNAYAGGGSGLFYSMANARLLPNASIPPGTGVVRVTMQWQSADAPMTLGLRFHGADQQQNSVSRVWETPGPSESQAGRRVYDLQVHPAQADSPYANKTGWDFTWYHDYDMDNLDGSGHFKGTIRWVINVYKLGFEP